MIARPIAAGSAIERELRGVAPRCGLSRTALESPSAAL